VGTGCSPSPFSARKAGELARKQINELVSDGKDWRLKAISMEVMRDDRHWIYVVEFEPPFSHPDLNREFPFKVIVLMDGTLITPTITSVPIE